MEEVELKQYWAIIRRRWKMVLAIPVIAVIVSAVYSLYVITPQYQANSTLLINPRPTTSAAAAAAAGTSQAYEALQLGQAMVPTYTQIIKSYSVEQSVIKALNLPMTPGTLNGMINVTSPTQSEVIQISVTDPSLTQAVEIANTLASTFQQKARMLMQVQNVQIIDSANAAQSPTPVKPNKKLNVAIALVLGLMVSIGLAFLLEYLDNRIRTVDDVRRYLDLPVLGMVVEHDLEG